MRGRGPVVHLDRRDKARMIEAVLSDFLGGPVEGLRILDIGCGNGEISEHLLSRNQQYAVDVVDQRRNRDAAYEFRLTTSEQLPFDGGFFDVVISHHVIEHLHDQARHLREVRRVVRPQGVVYLATPNKSSPIMEGHVGNDRVLCYRQMVPLFQAHGFEPREYTVRMLRDPERLFAEVRWARWIPEFALRWMRPLFPSHVFILVPAAGRATSRVKVA